MEPSRPPGDAPCPRCGVLLWFPIEPNGPLVSVWEYGIRMIERGEVVAGVELLQSVVAHKPGDVEQRRSLRVIVAGIGDMRRFIGDLAPAVLNEVWCDIRRAKHKRASQLVDWDGVGRAAERGLAIEPRDADLHVELGQACRARGHIGAARFAFQCALELAPERTDVRDALEGLAEA